MRPSTKKSFSRGLLIQVTLNIVTLIFAATLSLYPWIDHFIIKDLMSKDGRIFTLWREEQSITSKRVYFFNVTNPKEFIETGEKLKLVEFGPFVIKQIANNYPCEYRLISYDEEHNKDCLFIRQEFYTKIEYGYIGKDERFTVPNVEKMTQKAYSPNCSAEKLNTSTLMNQENHIKPFISLTLEQLLCGYGNTLHYPNLNHYEIESTSRVRREKVIGSQDIYKFPGSSESIQNLGYMKRLGNLSILPQWNSPPCTEIRASEGFLFPPRDFTKSDMVRLYSEHMCRVIPLEYKEDVYRYGLRLGLYSPPSTAFDGDSEVTDNSCYCLNKTCPPKGLQDVSPCYDGMPVYVSFPHFYEAERTLLDNFKGLQPDELRHRTYFAIQPAVGVSMANALRVQFNVKLKGTPKAYGDDNSSLPDVYVPIMWIERILSAYPSNYDETIMLNEIYAVTVMLPLACRTVQYVTIVTSLLCLTYLYVKVGRSKVNQED